MPPSAAESIACARHLNINLTINNLECVFVGSRSEDGRCVGSREGGRIYNVLDRVQGVGSTAMAWMVGCAKSSSPLTSTAPCTLHTTLYTLHTTHSTLHTTHFTLHSTHYTLHPCTAMAWMVGCAKSSSSRTCFRIFLSGPARFLDKKTHRFEDNNSNRWTHF